MLGRAEFKRLGKQLQKNGVSVQKHQCIHTGSVTRSKLPRGSSSGSLGGALRPRHASFKLCNLGFRSDFSTETKGVWRLHDSSTSDTYPCGANVIHDVACATKQQHQVRAWASCYQPIFKLTLDDVKRHVTTCTVVMAISMSPHDSLEHHLFAWRWGVGGEGGLLWLGDWADDSLVCTHVKHFMSMQAAQKQQDG